MTKKSYIPKFVLAAAVVLAISLPGLAEGSTTTTSAHTGPARALQ